MPTLQAPPPANRPKFWRYVRERDLGLAEVAKVFDRSSEWVRLICLPFDDPKRRTPDEADIRAIHEWTGGEVGAGDWYPPDLAARAEPASPAAVPA